MHDTPLQQGIKALNAGRIREASSFFQQALAEEESPATVSYLAYCRAKEEGAYKEAVSACMEAMKEEPKDSVIYLNLGKIYILAGQKRSAIRVFQLGLRYEKNPLIEKELASLGHRKSPPIPFLPRNNPLNKFLGKLLKSIGLR